MQRGKCIKEIEKRRQQMHSMIELDWSESSADVRPCEVYQFRIKPSRWNRLHCISISGMDRNVGTTAIYEQKKCG